MGLDAMLLFLCKYCTYGWLDGFSDDWMDKRGCRLLKMQ